MKKIIAVFILLLAGGILAAADSIIDYSELSSLIAGEEDYLLLDVRTSGEYQSGHIPTAQLIPYDVLPRGLESRAKDELIIVYCRSGRRSGIAAETLKAAGFSNVRDFGGISRWKGVLE